MGGAADPRRGDSLVGIGESAGQWWLDRRTMSRAAFTRYLSEFVWHALEGTTAEMAST